MVCPRCEANGSRTVITSDTAYNAKDDEFYRKRRCRACGLIFYTVEWEVPFDDVFKRKWDMTNPSEDMKVLVTRQRLSAIREYRKKLSKINKENNV